VLAGLLYTQRTTFTQVSNPSQPAQADSGQGRQSIYKESWVLTSGVKFLQNKQDMLLFI
jgi:hypothetical protein